MIDMTMYLIHAESLGAQTIPLIEKFSWLHRALRPQTCRKGQTCCYHTEKRVDILLLTTMEKDMIDET